MKIVAGILFLLPVVLTAQVFEELPDSSNKKKLILAPIVYGAHPEISPSYPGGEDSLRVFINRKLNFPQHDTCQSETVWIGFIVEKTGEITNVELLRGKCQVFVTEAIRVVEQMPKWVPGTIDEKPCRVKMRFPIKFG